MEKPDSEGKMEKVDHANVEGKMEKPEFGEGKVAAPGSPRAPPTISAGSNINSSTNPASVEQQVREMAEKAERWLVQHWQLVRLWSSQKWRWFLQQKWPFIRKWLEQHWLFLLQVSRSISSTVVADVKSTNPKHAKAKLLYKLFALVVGCSVLMFFRGLLVWNHHQAHHPASLMPCAMDKEGFVRRGGGSGGGRQQSNPKQMDELESVLAQEFYKHHLHTITTTVNSSSVLAWNTRVDYAPLFKLMGEPYRVPRIFGFETAKELLEKQQGKEPKEPPQTPKDWSIHKLIASGNHYVKFAEGICAAAKVFNSYFNDPRYKSYPHVLILALDENWGEFSTPIPDRTTDNPGFTLRSGTDVWLQQGCSLAQILHYLDHPDMRAAVTTQFQMIKHPKVHSLPLGIRAWSPDMTRLMPELKNPTNVHERGLALQKADPDYYRQTRPQLLMVNSAQRKMRNAIVNTVIENFQSAGIPLQNTYNDTKTFGAGYLDYVQELRRSKFLLSPSGLGLDCYRHWEALFMGTIPVIETLNRTHMDGYLAETLGDDLPIAWIDSYENLTPEWLHQQYPKILARAHSYDFAKLTRQYWTRKIQATLE